MNKKRDRLEVMYDILKLISKNPNIGPTKLIRLSNLSSEMGRNYILELKNKSFIIEEIKGVKKEYLISEDGIQYLNKFHELKSFIDKFNL